jgi:hypothetical protein
VEIESIWGFQTRKLYLRWNELVLDEFYKQGDEEIARGLEVSPLMDLRLRKNLFGSQIGFINCIVKPVRCGCARLRRIRKDHDRVGGEPYLLGRVQIESKQSEARFTVRERSIYLAKNDVFMS